MNYELDTSWINASWIDEKIEEFGITRKELADAIFVGESLFSKQINNYAVPNTKQVFSLSKKTKLLIWLYFYWLEKETAAAGS